MLTGWLANHFFFWAMANCRNRSAPITPDRPRAIPRPRPRQHDRALGFWSGTQTRQGHGLLQNIKRRARTLPIKIKPNAPTQEPSTQGLKRAVSKRAQLWCFRRRAHAPSTHLTSLMGHFVTVSPFAARCLTGTRVRSNTSSRTLAPLRPSISTRSFFGIVFSVGLT